MGREARGRDARKLGMKRAANLPSIMIRCSRELEPGFEALLHGRYLDARHTEPRVDKHSAQLVVREASHVREIAQALDPVALHARLCVRNHVNHHHASARAHDARHLRNGRPGIGDVVQREPRYNDVEGALPKWQRPCDLPRQRPCWHGALPRQAADPRPALLGWHPSRPPRPRIARAPVRRRTSPPPPQERAHPRQAPGPQQDVAGSQRERSFVTDRQSPRPAGKRISAPPRGSSRPRESDPSASSESSGACARSDIE